MTETYETETDTEIYETKTETETDIFDICIRDSTSYSKWDTYKDSSKDRNNERQRQR